MNMVEPTRNRLKGRKHGCDFPAWFGGSALDGCQEPGTQALSVSLVHPHVMLSTT